MGYPTETKGYRVWIPDEGRCTISRNVVFDEEKVIKDLEASKEVKEVTEKEKLNKKKRVSFSTELIRGPSTIDSNEGIGPVHGGDPTDQDTSETETSENSCFEDESQKADAEQETTEVQNLDDYILARDRQRREIRPPSRFENADFVAYALASAEDIEQDETGSYFEATKSEEWKFWKLAADDEMKSLKKNETFEVVKKPEGKKVIDCRWLFKKKQGIPGVERPRHKGRLMAKGYIQVEGVDYHEFCACVEASFHSFDAINHSQLRLGVRAT